MSRYSFIIITAFVLFLFCRSAKNFIELLILRKIRQLASTITKIGVKRIKYNLTGIDLKELQPTRKYTRKLLNEQVLQIKQVKDLDSKRRFFTFTYSCCD